MQEKVGNFFTQLAGRKAEVKQRCRTVLQARAEELLQPANYHRPANVDSTLVSVWVSTVCYSHYTHFS